MSYQSLISFSNPYVKIGSSGQLEVYDVCGKLRVRFNCNGSIQFFNSDGLTQNIVVPDNQFLTKNNTLDDGSGNLILSGNLTELTNGSPNIASPNPFALGQAYYDGSGWNPIATSAMILRLGQDIPLEIFWNNGLTPGIHYSPSLLLKLDTFGNLQCAGINTAQAPQTPSKVLGTTYQNPANGKNLHVQVSLGTNTTTSQANFQISPDNVTFTSVAIWQGGTTSDVGTTCMLVPSGYYYKVTAGSGIQLVRWVEQTF
jgi:hypothetical protein